MKQFQQNTLLLYGSPTLGLQGMVGTGLKQGSLCHDLVIAFQPLDFLKLC